MFHTEESSEIPMFDELIQSGEKSWWFVKKRLHTFWFHVVYEYKIEENESIREIYLIDLVSHLLELDKEPMIKIVEVDIVTPGYMNGSKRWEMSPLLEIISGKDEKYDQEVNVFSLTNGKRYLEPSAQIKENEIIDPRVVFKVH